MPIILGGGKCWKVRRHGDICAAFHWINQEPAIVLYPAHRRIGVTPFAIPLDSAYDYAETGHLIEKAALAADLMGFGSDRQTIHRIASIINDALPDLLSMPPEPGSVDTFGPRQGEEVKFTIDGTTVAEFGA